MAARGRKPSASVWAPGLCAARRRQGLTQAELAEQMEVSSGTVQGWENMRFPVQLRYLPELRRILQCSAEDLTEAHGAPEFDADRFRRMLRARGLSCRMMAEEMGVTKACISGWQCGAYEPSLDQIEHLCTALDCRYDDLYHHSTEEAG